MWARLRKRRGPGLLKPACWCATRLSVVKDSRTRGTLLPKKPNYSRRLSSLALPLLTLGVREGAPALAESFRNLSDGHGRAAGRECEEKVGREGGGGAAGGGGGRLSDGRRGADARKSARGCPREATHLPALISARLAIENFIKALGARFSPAAFCAFLAFFGAPPSARNCALAAAACSSYGFFCSAVCSRQSAPICEEGQSAREARAVSGSAAERIFSARAACARTAGAVRCPAGALTFVIISVDVGGAADASSCTRIAFEKRI